MQRRGGGGRDAVDIEGGDGGDSYDDDKMSKNKGAGNIIMGVMPGIGAMPDLTAGADFGRMFQPSSAGDDPKFFLDLRDKMLVAG